MKTRPTMRTAISLVVALIGLALAEPTAAQFGRASPHESTGATIDGADLRIVYGRPSMRGRRIMGDLVPFGRVWTPGADEVTTLTTSKAIRVGDLELPPGSYAVWMLPTRDAWTLIVSSETRAFHTFHDAGTDIGRVVLEKRTTDTPVEQLTFAIEPNPAGGGWIKMTWETTEVTAPFAVLSNNERLVKPAVSSSSDPFFHEP